jgi:hypothetical protein
VFLRQGEVINPLAARQGDTISVKNEREKKGKVKGKKIRKGLARQPGRLGDALKIMVAPYFPLFI